MKAINWDRYRAAVKTSAFRRKMEYSLSLIEEFSRTARHPYLSYSGGKDSGVCAHLVRKVMPEMPVFTQKDDMDWPGKSDWCRERIADMGFVDHVIVDSPVSVADQFKSAIDLGKETKEITGAFFAAVISYVATRGADGVILGLRREESRARQMNFSRRGDLYCRKDGMLVCCPIARWNSQEVIGYHVEQALPLYHVYHRMGKYIGPENCRLAWPVHPRLLGLGECVYLKLCYPEVWQKLLSCYPMLSAYV